MATTIPPLPRLDRTDPDFPEQVDEFFADQLPDTVDAINIVGPELETARDQAVAARNETVPLANQVIVLAPQAIAASATVQSLAPQVAANAAQVQTDKAQVATMVAGATQVQMGGSTGYPTIGPSLICNFAHAQRLSRKLSFTRAGAATYVDQLGRLRTAASGMPVFEFDAAGRSLGYRSEPSRTNLILNSATMATQSATVTAQMYTLSFTGTGTVTRSGVSTGALVGTGAANRVSVSFTPTAGSLTMTVSGSVTNAQLEAGSSATSYIATTGSAVTRPADILTLPAAAAADVLNPAQGAFVIEFSMQYVPTGSEIMSLVEYSDSTAQNRIFMFYNGFGAGSVRARVVAAGIDLGIVSIALPAVPGQRIRCALEWGGTGLGLSVNGSDMARVALTAPIPSGLGRVDIFNTRGSQVGHGHFAQFYPYARPLTDAELIAVSRL